MPPLHIHLSHGICLYVCICCFFFSFETMNFDLMNNHTGLEFRVPARLLVAKRKEAKWSGAESKMREEKRRLLHGDGRTDGRRWGTAGLVGYLLGPGPFGILISSASAYRLPLVDSPAITGTTPSPFAIIGGTAPPIGALPSGAVCPHFVWALLAVDLWAMATVFSRLQRCTCSSYYLCRRFSFFPFSFGSM
ncbi:hypothetical protein PVAP13_6KG035700 [Panicum virgatum]|uniref:Uncharacterized protein n=1 Tax=Panicum virgatum TaxID=38727 RepID=A0A8T0R867_PANVG|nr:hypothetical protein PVAP13_6KG035700 [Panicum virgatum]